MNLVDRYLQAVKFWLPRGQKRDIAAELSEEIRSQIEEQESAKDRSLSEDEIAAILQRMGRPIVVAGRFLPSRALIGSALFPAYLLTLKCLLGCFLLPWLVVWLLLLAFVPSYQTSRDNGVWLGDMWQWWNMSVYSFGIATGVFALIERHQATARFMASFDPTRLPAARDDRRIRLGATIVEAVLLVIALGVWIDLPREPVSYDLDGKGTLWTPGSTWQSLHGDWFLPLTINQLAMIALSAVNIARPFWTRWRRLARAAFHVVPALVILWVLREGAEEFQQQWRSIHAKTSEFADVEKLTIWTNINVYICLVITVAICLGVAIRDTYRAVNWNKD